MFLGISIYLIFIGISFIALSYLLVYVGAVSILFLFILMLINVRISELVSNTSNNISLAVIISLLFSYLLNNILQKYFEKIVYYKWFTDDYDNILKNSINTSVSADEIIFVTGKSWDSFFIESTHIINIGNILYTNYSIWLVITSIILLLAMVGAIVVTIKQK